MKTKHQNGKEKAVIKQYLYGHDSPETAYLIEDYPYGYTMRTQMRVWLESNKKGDRICRQTLNPKTGKWNAPKESTYNEIGVLGINEEDHVTWVGMGFYDNEEVLDKFLEPIDQTKLNSYQKERIDYIRAVYRTNKHVTVSVVNSTAWTPEQEEAHKKEQEEQRKLISKDLAIEYTKIKKGLDKDD